MAIIPPDQKFHTLDPITPTQERGSALANAGREIYTMQDIIDTVGGGGGGGVSSLDTLTGDITLVGAGDVTITNNGSDQITISALTGVASLEALTGALNIVGAGTVTVTDNGVDTITITGSGGGGGATTGEKLDFTVRTSAYTGATGEHEGIDLKIGGAASVTAGLAYYWNGNWNASDAVLPASGDGLMAVATATGTGVNMMQKGIIQLAANPTGASAGSVLYFETSGTGTAGTLTATPPSASGNIVRVAGHAIDAAGLVYFDPSEDWLEIV